MTKKSEQNSKELSAVLELEETDELDLQNTDVGFLLDKDGNLKTVFGPSKGFENPSPNLAAILEIFGICELVKPNKILH